MFDLEAAAVSEDDITMGDSKRIPVTLAGPPTCSLDRGREEARRERGGAYPRGGRQRAPGIREGSSAGGAQRAGGVSERPTAKAQT